MSEKSIQVTGDHQSSDIICAGLLYEMFSLKI